MFVLIFIFQKEMFASKVDSGLGGVSGGGGGGGGVGSSGKNLKNLNLKIWQICK